MKPKVPDLKWMTGEVQALCVSALLHVPVREMRPHCTGMEVRGMSVADAISYLNKTTVPIIGNES